MCTRVSSSYLNLTGRRGSLCGECESPPRQGSSARTAHSRTAGAREPVKLWGREGAGASRAAPKALALPWNPSKTSPRKSLCGARQRRRKIHSPDEAMKRCISWCVSSSRVSAAGEPWRRRGGHTRRADGEGIENPPRGPGLTCRALQGPREHTCLSPFPPNAVDRLFHICLGYVICDL